MRIDLRKCSICGGTLKQINDQYECEYCDSFFDVERENREFDKIVKFLDEEKEEKLSNARFNLYDATHEKNLSKDKIKTYVNEVKRIYPDDFLASFYESLLNDDKNVLNDFLSRIDLPLYDDYKDEVINATIKSMDYANVISLKNFVDRSCDVDEKTKYNTIIEELALKMDEGIYNLNLDRDFFVCYSSKDMDKVIEIVKLLESNKLTCFVALRNLRHGIGTVENYKESLEKAMRNSKAFLFISSINSKDMSCDSLRFELPYLKNYLKDKERIEFEIDKSSSKIAPIVKNFIKDIFVENDKCKNEKELLEKASSIIFSSKNKVSNSNKNIGELRYCIKCGKMNKVGDICDCGSKEFASDLIELLDSLKEMVNDSVSKIERECQKSIDEIYSIQKEKILNRKKESLKEKEALEKSVQALEKEMTSREENKKKSLNDLDDRKERVSKIGYHEERDKIKHSSDELLMEREKSLKLIGEKKKAFLSNILPDIEKARAVNLEVLIYEERLKNDPEFKKTVKKAENALKREKKKKEE